MHIDIRKYLILPIWCEAVEQHMLTWWSIVNPVCNENSILSITKCLSQLISGVRIVQTMSLMINFIVNNYSMYVMSNWVLTCHDHVSYRNYDLFAYRLNTLFPISANTQSLRRKNGSIGLKDFIFTLFQTRCEVRSGHPHAVLKTLRKCWDTLEDQHVSWTFTNMAFLIFSPFRPNGDNSHQCIFLDIYLGIA